MNLELTEDQQEYLKNYVESKLEENLDLYEAEMLRDMYKQLCEEN